MTREEYRNQFTNIINKLDTCEFKSTSYAEDRGNPFLTDKGVYFIINELKSIINSLKYLYSFQGNKKTKNYYLNQFEVFYLMIDKKLEDSLYYELKKILDL